MVASTFDLFKIGIGPSSSHTMGPMTAAADFAGRAGCAARIEIALYGSLALTGKGRATDRAVLLGLGGHLPAEIDPDIADAEVVQIRRSGRLRLAGQRDIAFDEARDMRFLKRQRLDFHSNAMTLVAFEEDGCEPCDGPTLRSAEEPFFRRTRWGAMLPSRAAGMRLTTSAPAPHCWR